MHPWTLPLIVALSGCAAPIQPDEYRESQNRVKKFSTEASDDSLRIVTFVKLSDGTIQDPKMYYYQMHHTAIGVRRVEKPGGLFGNVFKKHEFIYLPVSEEITDYLFLVSRSIVSEVEKDGVKRKVRERSDWALHKVAANTIVDDNVVAFPAFENLTANVGEDEKLLAYLRKEYSKAETAAKVRMNTPVKSRSEVPWYAQ